MKLVINRCYGGFSLSEKAIALCVERGADIDPNRRGYDAKRDDPIVIGVVEELGAEANGAYASLEVVEIPDDVDWEIEEYDGSEWVSEAHRTW